ncbi:Exported zinc metalloprotease YfgC precursor [gamma proteobacterium IMCC1989]|nr:Exported zinc metalloprotease YfgC precursor [gamma proteobacterium IMCC1989]
MLAFTENRQYDKADELLNGLLRAYPDNVILQISKSRILAGKNQLDDAVGIIQQQMALYPNYYPLAFQLSQIYREHGNHGKAITVLNKLSEKRPEDPVIWYELAEIAGLSSQLSTLNKARAEYFILHANFDNAEQQLNALIEREKAGSPLQEYGKERLQELDTIRKRSKL